MLKLVDTKLPKDKFGKDSNLDLIAHVNYVLNNRSHVGLRNTKTRSEVNRTTKKVYKQKGTGGARHGSRRANVFVGGGIVFGPRAVKRTLYVTRKMKQIARNGALSLKAKAGEIKVVSGIDKLAKTSDISKFLKSFETKKVTFFVSEKNLKSLRYFRNIRNLSAMPFAKANVLNILNGGLVFIDDSVFEASKKEAVNKSKKAELKKK